MKNLTLKRLPVLMVFFLALTSLIGCVHVHHPHTRRTVVVKEKRIPPGHAKKMSGDRSARRHAPGHNKHNQNEQ